MQQTTPDTAGNPSTVQPQKASEGPLSGCVALVTGASSGIGAATARALAAQGASLALVARRAERLEELAGDLREAGGSALALAADLSDEQRSRAAVQDAVDHFGRLDVLVNNAGYMARGALEDGDPADWRRTIELNLTSVLHLSHAALPHLLRAAGEGPRRVADLVNISSVAGRVPRKENSVYSASKHGLFAFSEALRQEVTGRGVRVGQVEPGMTATELTTAGGASVMARGIPVEKWLVPEDVARAVVFMTTQPPHAAVNELMVRPTAQEH